MDRHGEGGSGNVAVGAIVHVDAQQVARARRHDDIPVGQHLGRVGVSARLGVEHRLLVRNADQRHAAARSRDEHARTVVDRFGLVGQIEPRLFRSRKPAVGGRPLPGDLSRRLVDHHDPVLGLLGQNHHLRGLVQVDRLLLVVARPPGNVRSLLLVFAASLKEECGSQYPQIFFHNCQLAVVGLIIGILFEFLVQQDLIRRNGPPVVAVGVERPDSDVRARIVLNHGVHHQLGGHPAADVVVIKPLAGEFDAALVADDLAHLGLVLRTVGIGGHADAAAHAVHGVVNGIGGRGVDLVLRLGEHQQHVGVADEHVVGLAVAVVRIALLRVVDREFPVCEARELAHLPGRAVGLAEERAPGIEIRRRETRIEVVVLAHRGRTVGRRPVVHHQIEQRCVVAVLDAVNVERIDGRVLGLREFDVEDALAAVLVRRQEEFPVVAEQVVACLRLFFDQVAGRLGRSLPLRRVVRGIDQLAGLEKQQTGLEGHRRAARGAPLVGGFGPLPVEQFAVNDVVQIIENRPHHLLARGAGQRTVSIDRFFKDQRHTVVISHQHIIIECAEEFGFTLHLDAAVVRHHGAGQTIQMGVATPDAFVTLLPTVGNDTRTVGRMRALCDDVISTCIVVIISIGRAGLFE